jgi:hypothetical protein
VVCIKMARRYSCIIYFVKTFRVKSNRVCLCRRPSHFVYKPCNCRAVSSSTQETAKLITVCEFFFYTSAKNLLEFSFGSLDRSLAKLINISWLPIFSTLDLMPPQFNIASRLYSEHVLVYRHGTRNNMKV